jgi:ABC-type transport system substrate-binding protein
MRGKGRLAVLIMTLALFAGVTAACGSSTPSGTGGSTTTTNPAVQIGEKDILPPAATTAAPTSPSGTLKIVGSGDVDHLDTCCAYYTTTYELLRAISRQLVSYASSAADPAPTTVVPDIATWTISPNGLTYTFTIKSGVMWDAPSGPRQVTSYDEVLGIKRLCNPVSPAPPITYWEDNIAGMPAFCQGFQKISLPKNPATEIANIKTYIDDNQISGLATPSSSVITITLQHPSSSFINIMAMPMSSPVPEEILNYLPASVQEEENFISDGPYTLSNGGCTPSTCGYVPNVSYHLVRNPYWKQSTDSLRHQYFNAISVSMGNNATTIQQELETGAADVEWDTTVPSADVEQLTTSPQFVAGYIGGVTYLVFNMNSTADGGALKKVAVRQALQYCVNKRHIIQESGGPIVNVASNQILPPQMTGFELNNEYATPSNEGDQAKCKSLLAAAGYPNGLTLTLVYPNNPPAPDQAAALQSDFAMGGVTLKLLEVSSQGQYFDDVETPSYQKNWDIAFGAWFPDWDGNGAQSFFSPLFDGSLYGTGSTNYGDYNIPYVNNAIHAALRAPSVSAAASDWAALDKYITDENPGWIPLIYEALPQFIGKNVEGATYNGFLGYVDITNLWLKSQ